MEKATSTEGLAATDAVNQDALGKSSTSFATVVSGAGGLLEMINIWIGFLQNFGIVVEIDIPWPESFKAMFTWLEVFSLDFSVFGRAQLGVWTSIWTGLLVPIWLIWIFDARRGGGSLGIFGVFGLTYTRSEFDIEIDDVSSWVLDAFSTAYYCTHASFKPC